MPHQDEESFVHVGNTRLRVSVRGSGHPVLLLNGIGAPLSMWGALQPELDGLRVVAFEAPGTGTSSTPVLPYTLSGLARIVTGLLDHLDLGVVDVVGYSFGGFLAQQLAHDAPDRVRRLVLAATSCGWGCAPGPASSLLAVATPARYYSKLFYRLTNPLVAGAPAETTPEFVERTAPMRMAAPPSVPGYLHQFSACSRWSSLPWLDEVNTPTLVVMGGQDRLLPVANGHLLASRLPDARLSIHPEWGHLLLLDRASGAGPAIGNFLRAESVSDSAAWQDAMVVTADEATTQIRRMPGALQPLSLFHRGWRRLVAVNGG